MQKKTKLITKVVLSALLLGTIISFTNCQKDGLNTPDVLENVHLDEDTELSASTSAPGNRGTLNTKNARSDGGFAYRLSTNIGNGDVSGAPNQSILKVYENGVELGPAHAVHEDIRKIGKGRYSHWGTSLYFSASDNSDPRSNGRKYTYTVGDQAPEEIPTTPDATVVVNTSSGISDGGFAIRIPMDAGLVGDTNDKPTASTMRLFENGVELGPAHAVHDDIRKIGKGRYSHWGTSLYFSASDNSDPRTNGRTYTYVIGAATTNPEPPTTPSNPGVNTDGLMGYAMVNGSTTGGKGGAEVTVTTLAELKAALGDYSPKIIYVSGTIKGAGVDPIFLQANKSVIGKSGAVLEGLQLFIYGVGNVIIQNLTFRNYVTYAAVQVKEGGHHVWIDHCDFGNDREHGWSHWGKDITITEEADYVTVSWNKFHDTNLSVLISGGVEGHESDKGKLHVTMHHNFWYNVSEREPSMNYGRVHMFNNYHLNNGGYSIGTRAGGIVRTDNEYFLKCNIPLSTKVAQDPEGYISGINTNIYDNCGPNNITTAESNWVPEYEYKSYLDAAANVPSIVEKGSGPR